MCKRYYAEGNVLTASQPIPCRSRGTASRNPPEKDLDQFNWLLSEGRQNVSVCFTLRCATSGSLHLPLADDGICSCGKHRHYLGHVTGRARCGSLRFLFASMQRSSSQFACIARAIVATIESNSIEIATITTVAIPKKHHRCPPCALHVGAAFLPGCQLSTSLRK